MEKQRRRGESLWNLSEMQCLLRSNWPDNAETECSGCFSLFSRARDNLWYYVRRPLSGAAIFIAPFMPVMRTDTSEHRSIGWCAPFACWWCRTSLNIRVIGIFFLRILLGCLFNITPQFIAADDTLITYALDRQPAFMCATHKSCWINSIGYVTNSLVNLCANGCGERAHEQRKCSSVHQFEPQTHFISLSANSAALELSKPEITH